MSVIYTIKTNKNIEFKDIFDKLIEKYSNLSAFEEDEENVFFYLNGMSIRGVYIKKIKTGFEIKNNVLSNKYDLIITNDILKYISEKTNGKVYGDENNLLSGDEYINKNELENSFERDLETVFKFIRDTNDTIEFPGTTRSFFIGKKLYSSYNDFSKNMKIEVLQKIILNVLYGLPEFFECSPMGAQSKQDDKIIKLKSISSNENCIIQDYDYIMIENTKNSDDIIMISKETISKILPKNWNFVDESTIIAYKLDQTEWNNFINICIKENCYNEFKMKAK